MNAGSALAWLWRVLFLFAATLTLIWGAVLIMALAGFSDVSMLTAGIGTAVPAGCTILAWFMVRDAVKGPHE